MRIGENKIQICYGGQGFTGVLELFLPEFFPATTTRMRRLMVICKMGPLPEIRYLIEILHYLEDLKEVHFSYTQQKRYNSNLKVIRDRIEELGGRDYDY